MAKLHPDNLRMKFKHISIAYSEPPKDKLLGKNLRQWGA